MKALGSLKCFNSILSLLFIKTCYFASYESFPDKHILSISGLLFVKFNKAFVFPDPEISIISILYGISAIYDHFKLCFVLFSLYNRQN